MKTKTHIALLILMFATKTYSQINLVPNPSFEDTLQCPNNQGQASYAIGWYETGSADYFNICSVNPSFSVPHNWGGYQQPASGNAYCALVTYETSCPNCREYVGTTLITPLSIGAKYYVSFKVNLSLMNPLQVNCASNNLGTLFSTQQLNIYIPLSSAFNPQVNHTSKVTDTLNWTRVFGSYVADSAYTNVCIGNFFLDNVTDTLIMDGGNTCTTYYYIDDVCVTTDSLFAAQYNYIPSYSENEKKSITIFPNPAINYSIVKNSGGNIYNCVLYDELSKKIKSFNLQPFSEMKIDVSDLSEGIYCLRIESLSSLLTKKIIKQ